MKSHPDKPAYNGVFEPQNAIRFDASPSKIQQISLRNLPHLEKSGISLGLIDDLSVLSTAPWTLPVPSLRLDLATFKQDTTDPVRYEQFYLKPVSYTHLTLPTRRTV